MTRTVTFDCPRCSHGHAGVTVVNRKCECPRTAKTIYFDDRHRPIDPDEPADDLNALLDDIIEEDRAWREFRATLVGFGFGVAVGATGGLIAWLFLLS